MPHLRAFQWRSKRAFVWLGLVLALALGVRHWIWVPTLVQGASMWPSLKPGQLAGINKLAYASRLPTRGDIVAVWTGKEVLIKRVVGLPGEMIGMRRGVFCVNGVPLPEPYVQCQDEGQDIAAGRIEPNCVVVASDNRPGGVIAVVGKQRIVGQIVTFSSMFHRLADALRQPGHLGIEHSAQTLGPRE
jgi:signal peptidase I